MNTTTIKPSTVLNPRGINLSACLLLSLGSLPVYAADVKLAWDSVASASAYKVYVGTSSGNYTDSRIVIAATPQPATVNYTLSGLPDGTRVFVAVKSTDATAAVESVYSNEVSTTLPAAVPLDVSFTASPGTTLGAYTFTPKVVSGIVAKWTWTFDGVVHSTGDGTAPIPSVTKTFSAGAHTAILAVQGPAGSNTADSATQPFTVEAPPVAGFTASALTGIAPLAVTFTDKSTGNITTRSWVFKTGTTTIGTSSAANPTQTFSAGNYTASLTVTGPGGTNSTSQTITVATATPVDPTPTPTPTVGPKGIVGAWRFDEIGGSIAVDSSGNQNHGTLGSALAKGGQPPTRVSHKGYSGAVEFKRENATQVDPQSWITVEDSDSLDLKTAMTIEAWVYMKSPETSRNLEHLLWKESDLGAAAYYFAANTELSTPGLGNTIGGLDNLMTADVQPVMPVIPRGEWAYIAATYDSKTQQQVIYRNGVEVGRAKAAAGENDISAGPLRMGGNGIPGQFFTGIIDEVRLYNRVLTLDEINTDMKTPIRNTLPSVVLVGDKTIHTATQIIATGGVEAYQATAGKNGAVFGTYLYVGAGTTAGKVVFGIYEDNLGHPGKLLTQGSSTSPLIGKWALIAHPAAKLQAGKKYWIAVMGANGGNLQVRQQGGAGTALRERRDLPATATQLPEDWGTVYTSSTGGAFSVYSLGN